MSEKNFRPMSDGLVVAKEPDDSLSKSSLLVVSSGVPSTMIAKVLAAGADVQDIKVGDRVLSPYYAGSEYEDVIFLAADAVLAVVED